MGAGSVFLRRGGGTIDRGRRPVDAGGGADALPDLTFTNFMIKTCRITDLLLKKEYQRAIALVEASLQLDARLISTAVRNFMYCGLSLCYLAIGKLGKAAEWLDRSLSLAEQDRNYSFLAGFRKYFQVLFLLPSIAAKHERAIQDLDAVALVEPRLRRRELSVVRNQAAATSRGVLYGAARGAVEPRNA